MAQLYQQVMAQCELAEALGYDTFFCAEHHFHEYGMGSGYLAHEFVGYGRDPKEKRERFHENLDVVKRLLAGESFAYRGAESGSE